MLWWCSRGLGDRIPVAHLWGFVSLGERALLFGHMREKFTPTL